MASQPSGKKNVPLRTNGSLYGKFAPVLVYGDAVEIRSVSTVLLVVCLWLTAIFVFIVTSFLLYVFLSSLLTLLSGLAAFFLMTKYYRGRLEQRFAFKDLSSFVSDGPEFTFNTASNFMFSVRMSGKKQNQLLEQLAAQFRDNPDYMLVRMGKYLKVYPRKQEEAAPPPPPSGKKKPKAAPAAETETKSR